jgi:hypothetical protein
MTIKHEVRPDLTQLLLGSPFGSPQGVSGPR